MNISDRTINAAQGPQFSFTQSENAALFYVVNWAAVLQADTIAASEWSCQGSVAIASSSNTDTTATAKVSASPGRYRVVNKITTAAGNTDERMILLTVTDNDGYEVGDYEGR